jgi:hypothetical protein
MTNERDHSCDRAWSWSLITLVQPCKGLHFLSDKLHPGSHLFCTLQTEASMSNSSHVNEDQFDNASLKLQSYRTASGLGRGAQPMKLSSQAKQ